MLRRLQVILVVVLLVMVVAPLPSRAEDGKRHVVQAGETLFRIALRYGVTVDALASANGITNTASIYAGQVLVIPGAGNAQPDQTAKPVDPAPAANQPTYYTVATGDTLNKIAKRFNVSWQAIVTANGLANPNVISVGQRLLIPLATAPSAPTIAPVVNPTADAPLPTPIGGATIVGPTIVPDAATPAPAQAERVYVVKRGDGLGSIARQFGVDPGSLAEYNSISNPDVIYAGMVLKIPPFATATNPAANSGAVAGSGIPAAPIQTGKAILVILHQQRVYIYENGKLLRNVLVSTGLPGSPTVIGDFKIYVKYRSQLMTGPGYYLPAVPYVMYFYQGYGLHGTYWHNNFGRRMSHGCVNMPTSEAAWLYAWSEIGTPVYVRA